MLRSHRVRVLLLLLLVGPARAFQLRNHPAVARQGFRGSLPLHAPVTRAELWTATFIHSSIPVGARLRAPAVSMGPIAGAPPFVRDVSVALLLLSTSAIWIRVCTALSEAGYISSSDSRKLVHVGSGPFFVLAWPLFSRTASGQIAATAVPVLSVFRLLAASRAKQGSTLVKAVSRTGDSREALGGPMLYTYVLLASALFGWTSVIPLIAICQMAVGDGMADIIGRRFGRTKWPFAFAERKSVEGSLAFAGSAFVACLATLKVFYLAGMTTMTATSAAPALLAISVLCAIVELLPLGDDNITVPAAAALLSLLLLPTC